MNVDAYLESYVNAEHEAEASGDFDNTFAFGVTPSVSGLQIDWAISGDAPQSVPETGGLPLAAIALLCLFSLHRFYGANHHQS